MHWWEAIYRHKRLRRAGILGMNARNIRFIAGYNARKEFPKVDDKIITKKLAIAANISVPEQFGIIEFRGQFEQLKKLLLKHQKCVIKPARGSGGGGIILVKSANERGIRKGDGKIIRWDDLKFLVNNLLAGMYSLGSGTDRLLIEEKLEPHSAFANIAYGGIPDVRIIVFRGVPVMAMLRLPTAESDGKANLHMAGVGVGINLENGKTTFALQSGDIIDEHPDFQTPLTGIQLPHWEECLQLAAKIRDLCNLGYLGVDIVIDERYGPMMLELNARPGISIQVANQRGLLDALTHVRAMKEIPEAIDERIELGKKLYRQGK